MVNDENKYRETPDQPEMPPIPDISSIPPLPELKNDNNPVTDSTNYKNDLSESPVQNTTIIPPVSKGFDESHLEFAREQEKTADKNTGFSSNTSQNQQHNNNLNMNTVNQNQNYSYAQQRMQVRIPNSTGVLTLGILSIVSICCCGGLIAPVLAIIALALVPKAKRTYAENPGSYTISSFNSLKAGQICAIIGLVLGGIFLIYMIVVMAMDGSGLNEVNRAINEAWNETGY